MDSADQSKATGRFFREVHEPTRSLWDLVTFNLAPEASSYRRKTSKTCFKAWSDIKVIEVSSALKDLDWLVIRKIKAVNQRIRSNDICQRFGHDNVQKWRQRTSLSNPTSNVKRFRLLPIDQHTRRNTSVKQGNPVTKAHTKIHVL